MASSSPAQSSAATASASPSSRPSATHRGGAAGCSRTVTRKRCASIATRRAGGLHHRADGAEEPGDLRPVPGEQVAVEAVPGDAGERCRLDDDLALGPVQHVVAAQRGHAGDLRRGEGEGGAGVALGLEEVGHPQLVVVAEVLLTHPPLRAPGRGPRSARPHGGPSR